MDHRKNIVAENKNNDFLLKELFVIGKNKERSSLIDMSQADRIFQVKMRQRWIIKNYKDIEKCKETNDYKAIAKLHTVIKSLKVDVDKIKFAAVMSRESNILDSLEYQEFMGKFNFPVKEEKSDEDLLIEISDRNPALFAQMFVKFFKGQRTNIAMKYVKQITDNHQYVLVDKTHILE